MRYFYFAVLTLSLSLITACHTNEIKIHPLQQGLLRLEHSSVFAKYWGLPDKQYVTTSDQLTTANWSRHGGGGVFKGKQPVENILELRRF